MNLIKNTFKGLNNLMPSIVKIVTSSGKLSGFLNVLSALLFFNLSGRRFRSEICYF